MSRFTNALSRRMRVLFLSPILAVVAVAALVSTAAHASSSAADPRLAALRSATDPFHDISKAERAGYALLTDAKGIACIEMPGTLRLAAVEYVVIKQAWDATHSSAPRLFGQEFNFTDAPNRFGLPAFYSLHVWAWKRNPAGTFAMWNPQVSCRQRT